MEQIKTETAYRAAVRRIDELLKVVNNSTPVDDPNYLELNMISDLVAEYEEIYCFERTGIKYIYLRRG